MYPDLEKKKMERKSNIQEDKDKNICTINYYYTYTIIPWRECAECSCQLYFMHTFITFETDNGERTFERCNFRLKNANE